MFLHSTAVRLIALLVVCDVRWQCGEHIHQLWARVVWDSLQCRGRWNQSRISSKAVRKIRLLVRWVVLFIRYTI